MLKQGPSRKQQCSTLLQFCDCIFRLFTPTHNGILTRLVWGKSLWTVVHIMEQHAEQSWFQKWAERFRSIHLCPKNYTWEFFSESNSVVYTRLSLYCAFFYI